MEETEENYSYLTNAIVGTSPKWIVRWGIMIIFLTLVVLGLILSSVRYPVTIIKNARIGFEIKPIPIIVSGRPALITYQIPNDRSHVEAGETLVTLQGLSDRKMDTVFSPASGIYFLNRLKITSPVIEGTHLGFLLPDHNNRIIRLNLSAAQTNALRKDQMVVIVLTDRKSFHLSVKGKIIGIGSQTAGLDRPVQIALSPEIKNNVSARRLLQDLGEPECTVQITIARTSYLNYLLHR